MGNLLTSPSDLDVLIHNLAQIRQKLLSISRRFDEIENKLKTFDVVEQNDIINHEAHSPLSSSGKFAEGSVTKVD
jgi:hypothetical protein